MDMDLTYTGMRNRAARAVVLGALAMGYVLHTLLLRDGAEWLWAFVVLGVPFWFMTLSFVLRPPRLTVANGLLLIRLPPNHTITCPVDAVSGIEADATNVHFHLKDPSRVTPRSASATGMLSVPAQWFPPGNFETWKARLKPR